MIKQILFDCVGVLTENDYRAVLRRVGEGDVAENDACAQRFLRTLFRSDAWHGYDRGVISTERIFEEMKRYFPPEQHGSVARFLDHWLDAITPKEGMVEIVEALQKQGVRCYLLSNFPDSFPEAIRQVPVLSRLDGLSVSYLTHRNKPEPDAFLGAARDLGFRPEETLFVDDHAENADAASAAGMTGYRFTTPAAFRAALKQYGVKL